MKFLVVGSEYYFKTEDASSFDKESYISENGEDYWEWEEDDMGSEPGQGESRVSPSKKGWEKV